MQLSVFLSKWKIFGSMKRQNIKMSSIFYQEFKKSNENLTITIDQ